ncbi:pentapeptide repeat-containing protein [Cytobacillus horneckiae]|uniref:pentapeptide repeat-containing protein n=1 Tax=Cytobacillus horneckiae TaxID=549687 RepID=UPI0039A362BA
MKSILEALYQEYNSYIDKEHMLFFLPLDNAQDNFNKNFNQYLIKDGIVENIMVSKSINGINKLKSTISNLLIIQVLKEHIEWEDNNLAQIATGRIIAICNGYSLLYKYGNNLDLSNANLAGAQLRGISLERANLQNTNLKGANLERANLKNTNLTGSNLEGANLTRANLYQSKLENADLRRANLSYTDLRKSSIKKTSFRGAELWASYIWGVDFTKSFTSGVDLERADTRGS